MVEVVFTGPYGKQFVYRVFKPLVEQYASKEVAGSLYTHLASGINRLGIPAATPNAFLSKIIELSSSTLAKTIAGSEIPGGLANATYVWTRLRGGAHILIEMVNGKINGAAIAHTIVGGVERLQTVVSSIVR
jgi:hypothetical protein